MIDETVLRLVPEDRRRCGPDDRPVLCCRRRERKCRGEDNLHVVARGHDARADGRVGDQNERGSRRGVSGVQAHRERRDHR